MKQLKVLLSVVLACALTLSVAGCAANCGGTEEQPDKFELQSIALDTENVKTQFYIGDEFTSAGLKVTAEIENVTTGQSETKEVDIADVEIDSSAYDNQVVGSYTIEVSYTLEEMTKTADYTVTVDSYVKPQELLIDTTNVKLVYDLGEEFSANGLVATVVKHDSQSDTDLPAETVTDKVAIDSTAFNKSAEGDYEIKVIYTEYGVSVAASYTVSVKKAAGLVLESDDVDYVLSAEGTLVDIAQTVEVFLAGANGKKGEALTEGFVFSAYLGNKPVEMTDGQFTATQSGAYNVWATYEDYTLPGTTEVIDISGFIIIYVTDALQSITFNTDGSVTNQVEGTDEISETWTFTAHYASGAQKVITSEDVEITGLDTKTPTTAGEATVTFTELNCKGETMTSAPITVNYTIEEKPATPGQTNVYKLDIAALAQALNATDTSVDGKVPFTQDNLNASGNGFLTLAGAGSSDVYRSKYECIELKDGTLSVTFEGTGTLTISAKSTGTSNLSDLGLKGPSGAWVAATYDETNTNIAAVADGYYTVTGSDYNTLTFEITEAGTYTIESNISGANGRAARINSIIMSDTVGGAATETKYDFNVAALAQALNATDTSVDGKIAFTQDTLDASGNGFLTLAGAGSSDVYRSKYECIELKDGTLSVTFEGTGILTISARSTGTSNLSDLGLKGPSGEWVAATYDETNTNIVAVADGYYTVTGSDYNTLTFEITEAGTYTIESNISGANGRAVRINGISMVDTVSGAAVAEGINMDLDFGSSAVAVADMPYSVVVPENSYGITVTALGSTKARIDAGNYGSKPSRFNTQGAMGYSEGVVTAGVEITNLPAGATVIILGSASDVTVRKLRVMDAAGQTVEDLSFTTNNTYEEVSFTVETAGTYYFGSSSGGLYIAGIKIIYTPAN